MSGRGGGGMSAPTTTDRPVKSGWCIAPEGARPKHEGCRFGGWECSCHKEKS